MQKLRRGDEVVVMVGRDRGKRGVVVSRVDDRHLVVEGVNVSKRHVKPNPIKGVVGGVVEKLMPIDQSNLMLFNPSTGKGDRVAFDVRDGGLKVRVYKSTGQPVGA